VLSFNFVLNVYNKILAMSNIPASTFAAITAVGAYLPDYILTNHELESMVDTTDEWITTRTGIKERRILKGEGLGSSFMGAKAVQQLLEKRGIGAHEIDAVICATISPDMFFPSTANLICDKVGIKNALSFDLAAACSGFLYALVTGSMYIRSGLHKKVIVVGTDKMSAITDYSDRNNCIIFGDAAAAVLLEPAEEGYGLRDYILRTDPIGKDLIYMKAGGSAYPATHHTVENKEHYFFQDGKSVFKFAVTRMADVSEEIMQRNHLKSEDIAYLVPHQANKRIIDATAERMGVGIEKVCLNIQKYGNTTAATIPLCLWEWEKDFKKGDNLVLASFGAGFTYGSIWLRWSY
jgi:3-oxoacyl-[acyl-carrier-protein] synthase III